jgi:hypothetical protein
LLCCGYLPAQIEKLDRSELIDLVSEVRIAARKEKSKTMSIEKKKHDVEVGAKPVEPKQSDPTPTMPEWATFVMGQFADDELEGENPKVDGLRRVAEKLIGPILEEGCDLISPPTIENQGRACVKAWVLFKTTQGRKRFEGLADVYEGNCAEEYARFPTSVAESRARGRCFRAALKLRRVVAAEEMSGPTQMTGAQGCDTINKGQVSVIQIMADRLRVSLPALLNHLEIGKTDLSTLTGTEALLVVKNLNSLQDTGHVPASLMRA